MKKILKSLWIIFTALFFLSACSNIYSNMDNSQSSSSLKKLSVSVSSENNIVNFGSSQNARLISPANFTFSSNLDFYLWGTNLLDSSKDISRQEITISAQDSNQPCLGTFDFSFEKSYYRLYLAAVKSGNEYSSENILLSSSIAIDLRQCSEISFYLSSRTVSGNGELSLALYADNWTPTNEYEIKAGLYTQDDGSTIYESILANFPTYTSSPESPSYQFTKSNISSGNYDFILTFTKDFEGKNVTFQYKDTVSILAHQTTSAIIGIPNIISPVPNPASYLIAGYVDSSSSSSDYYDVEFCWDDTSYNEEDFQLQILDISELYSSTYSAYVPTLLDSFSSGSLIDSVSNSDMDSAWNSIVSALNSSYVHTYSREYFENTNITTDGSFTSNSVYAVLKLLYGKRYLARIRAVNSSGASDYTYLDLYNTANRTFAATNDENFSPVSWASDSSGINRYKIEYFFTNGIFYDDVSSENVSSSVSARIFTNQKRSSSYSILNPINYTYSGTSTASLKYLYNEVYYPWTKWKYNSNYGDDCSSSTYDGCLNLYLYAYYGDQAVISESGLVLKTSDIDYANADIVISGHASTAASIIPFQGDTDLSTSVSSNTLTVSKADYKYLNLLLNTTNNNYSSIEFFVSEQGGQGRQVSNLTTQYGGISYTYGQLDILAEDSDGNAIYQTGKSYYYSVYAVENGTSVSYMIEVKITE
ncbi:MAG: hypothetical protein K6C97_07680 [Treponema sp.]|nr:hypothetical protein [Treponema sp.]